MTTGPANGTGSANRPRRNRTWIWLFCLLGVASVAVAAFMIRYNLGLQLTRAQLDAARTLWQEKGPRSYLMVYTKQLNDDPRVEKFVVKVRAGQVQEVLLNGMPLEKENLPYHSMDQLFRSVSQFLDQDQKPDQPRTFTRAVFDEHTGALRSYTRRVMGTRQRTELTVVELKELPASGG